MADQAIESSAEGTVSWARLEKMRCELTVQVPVRAFGVRELMTLAAGTVVDTQWDRNKPVPLDVNGREVTWCEFEVLGERLGIRITELL